MTISQPPEIILLMAQQESDFFEEMLKRVSPECRCFHAETRDDLAEALASNNPKPILFAFLTKTIVPPDILSKLDQALNIHPGPPWMPGFRPTRQMVGKSDTAYGVTLHKMVEAVDAGPILAVRRFELPPNASLEQVESITYKNAVQLALKHLDMIAGLQNVPHHPTERWGQR